MSNVWRSKLEQCRNQPDAELLPENTLFNGIPPSVGRRTGGALTGSVPISSWATPLFRDDQDSRVIHCFRKESKNPYAFSDP